MAWGWIQDCVFLPAWLRCKICPLWAAARPTPGTISKRIQSLEDELCARLFDRTTRSIRITEEGAAFLARGAQPVGDRAARASVDARCANPRASSRSPLRLVSGGDIWLLH